ncbi:MAG: hypothetical protein MZV65_41505 [Chromatiales bacterium]|nr:hypothetical protein [Chromatiales bacterium]
MDRLLFGDGSKHESMANHGWLAPALATMLLSGCVGLLMGGTAVGVSVAHDRRTTGTVVDDQTIELKLYDALNRQLPPGNRDQHHQL